MNIRQLTTFLTVMRTRSATSAAVIVGISQPAVSQTLKQLERDLGLRLFVRINGRLTPTPEAERIAQEMETVVSSYDRMRGLVEDIRGQGEGILRIATLTYAHVFLPEALKQLQDVAPNAKVAIQVMTARAVVEAVSQGHADIGIVTNSADPQTTRFRDLRGSNVIAVVARDSDLSARDRITPRDLRGRRILSYDPQSPFGEVASRAFASVDERFEVNISVASSTLLCALVEQGAGVALLEPFILLGPSRFDVVVKPFWPEIEMRPRLILSASRPQSMLAQHFQRLFEANASRMFARANLSS